ncbi:hypothetical protein [Geomicrobium sediminis]|uniref:Uncharacterized protein n=1 Tax=Geomicrobium sediminis TaxID=1347788 RepID=A0ABS2P8V1_9BACL|nr:hypothetical protein [Geomicrobium sediminis]MBM7631742.1 hypothetical protein [Geomicrobium sediminis]
MKRSFIGILSATLVSATILAPASTSASTFNSVEGNVLEEFTSESEIEIIESNDDGSTYRYQVDNDREIEVVEEIEVIDANIHTITTKTYDITYDKELISESETKIIENEDTTITIIQDGEEIVFNPNEETEIISPMNRGGSSITQTRYSEMSSGTAYATIYPGNQKQTTASNSNYRTFKSHAQDLVSIERNLVSAGLAGLAEEIFRSIIRGNPFSFETVKAIVRATGKAIPIIGTATTLFNYGSTLQSARSAHGSI